MTTPSLTPASPCAFQRGHCVERFVRLSWTEMERRFVGGKYRGRTNVPGWQAKTVRVVDVNLGGDVAIDYRGSCGRPIIPQPDFLAWVEKATVLDEPNKKA